jgi:amino-acid N-acetyltransferase
MEVDNPRTREGLEQVAGTFRQMAPFIAAHRGTTVVIHVPGECLESELFPSLADDIVLLHTLGLKIVLVVGCRPQIDRRLYLAGAEVEVDEHGVRPCDEFVLQQVVESWGWCRVQLQSHVGRGLATGAQIKRLGLAGGMVHVASGNFVIAQPMGVIDGDFPRPRSAAGSSLPPLAPSADSRCGSRCPSHQERRVPRGRHEVRWDGAAC